MAKLPIWRFGDLRNVPGKVMYMLATHEITTVDHLLCYIIGSMLNSPNKKDKRCFVTNDYLAEALGRDSSYISSRLNRLMKLGIVMIIWVKDQRYLELAWSRTAEERAELTGAYGEECRRVHAQLPPLLDKSTDLGKPKADLWENPKLNLWENPKYNKESSEELNGNEEEREPGPRSPTVSSSRDNGRTSQKRATFASKSSERVYPDFCKVLAERLLKILQSRRPQIHVDPGTVPSRTKHIYDLWVEFGKDDDAKEKLSTQLDRLEEGINYIGFEIGSVAQFHQWYNRINSLLNEQDSPKDEDGKKIGKIYWDPLEIEEWVDELLPNGNTRSTLKTFKVRKRYRWEITQGDNGRPEFDKIWIDNPRTVSDDW